MNHEERKRRAFSAIDSLFSDSSIPLEETIDALGELKEHIDTQIDALERDIKKRDAE
jgi:hypothetical protein